MYSVPWCHTIALCRAIRTIPCRMCILTSSALSGRLRILCLRKFSVYKETKECQGRCFPFSPEHCKSVLELIWLIFQTGCLTLALSKLRICPWKAAGLFRAAAHNIKIKGYYTHFEWFCVFDVINDRWCSLRGMMPWSTSCSRVRLCWSLNCSTENRSDRNLEGHPVASQSDVIVQMVSNKNNMQLMCVCTNALQSAVTPPPQCTMSGFTFLTRTGGHRLVLTPPCETGHNSKTIFGVGGR